MSFEASEQAARRTTVMDVTEERIARVYGQAYLAAANKQPNPAELVEELQSLVHDVLDKFPRFAETLGSALISHEQKEQLLDNVLGGRASGLLINFLKVLSAHGRLDILRAVASAVSHLYNKQSGRVEVELQLADPIDEQLQSEIAETLRTTLGIEPQIEILIDPALIAGFVVRVGDTVYDGSIQNRFERARKAIVQRAIEYIESQPERFFNGETR